MFLFLFWVILQVRVRSTGRVPWWFDLHKAVPFLVEIVLGVLFAGIIRLAGEMPVWF
jgi:hypothetical protein